MSDRPRRPSRAARRESPRALLARAVVAAAVAAAVALPWVPASASPVAQPPRPATADVERMTDEPEVPFLLLDEVDPAVTVPGDPVTLTGRLVNPTDTAQRISALTASVSTVPLTSRVEIDSWLSGDPVRDTSRVLGDDTIGPLVPSGGAVPFRVVLPASATEGLTGSPSALALTLSATEDEDEGGLEREPVQLRTVLTTSGRTEVLQPLATSWVVPLTLPADDDLMSSDPDTHARAWSDALAPDSDVLTWLDELSIPGTTFVVDPRLLDPSRPAPGIASPWGSVEDDDTSDPAPEPTDVEPTAPSTKSPTEATSDQGDAEATTSEGTGDQGAATAPVPVPDDQAATTAPDEPPATTTEPAPDAETVQELATTVRTELRRLPEDRLWWLPAGDPDLTLLAARAPIDAAASVVGAGATASDDEELAVLLSRGRRDVAWPVDLSPSPTDLAAITEMYARRTDGHTSRLGLVVLPQESLVGATLGGPATGAATLTDPEGTRALGTDSWTSALVADSSDQAAREGAGAATQRVLAHTLGAYLASPAEARSLVVAPPRHSDPDPEVLAQLSDAWRDAPWLRPVPASATLEEAEDSEPVSLTEVAPDEDVLGALLQHLSPGATPVDDARARGLVELDDELSSLGGILADTGPLRSWESVLSGLWSTRWRDDAAAWERLWRILREDVQATTRGVHITPSTVNFLADTGTINVTVVNELGTDVHDVQLELETSNGRLQITRQPDPVSVGAGSRASVSFEARSITRGDTTLTARMSTPDGTVLGTDAAIDVRVQPTGTWLYWVLGGLAGLVLVLGLARAVRRGPRPAPGSAGAPDALRADDEGTV